MTGAVFPTRADLQSRVHTRKQIEVRESRLRGLSLENERGRSAARRAVVDVFHSLCGSRLAETGTRGRSALGRRALFAAATQGKSE